MVYFYTTHVGTQIAYRHDANLNSELWGRGLSTKLCDTIQGKGAVIYVTQGPLDIEASQGGGGLKNLQKRDTLFMKSP